MKAETIYIDNNGHEIATSAYGGKYAVVRIDKDSRKARRIISPSLPVCGSRAQAADMAAAYAVGRGWAKALPVG